MKGSFNKVVLIVIVMIIGLGLVGCYSNEGLSSTADEYNSVNNSDNMSDEDIMQAVEKQILGDYNMEIDTIEIIDQVSNDSKLIKVTRKTTSDVYILYQRELGEFYIMPTSAEHVDSYEIVNENHLIFNVSGTNSESSYHVPPRSIDCRKTVLEDGTIGFVGTYKTWYHPLNESINFGGKADHKLTDVIVTLTGLQLAFGPQDPSDAGYFAAYTTSPYTTTSYNKEEMEFVIELQETIIDEELIDQGLKIEKENANIDSIVLEERDNSVVVIIELNEDSSRRFSPKYYTAEIGETSTVPAYIDIKLHYSDR